MATVAAALTPKKKILLVVANLANRNLRASVLRKRGMDVVCTGAVSDARMLWHPSTYDLVLFDIRRDNSGAVELSRDMKAEDPAQRVAFLVGKPGILAAMPAYDDGFEEDTPTDCEQNVRQLMANACEALPRRGGFLEARWRMALARSVRPEQAKRPPSLIVKVVPRARVVEPIDVGEGVSGSFGDAVRQAEADQDASL